jgi:hypothetical protein
MDDLIADLRESFEAAGYDIGETSVNRDRVRVAVLDPEASGEELRSLTLDVVDEDEILGFNVTTESPDSGDVSTVVTFRYRG